MRSYWDAAARDNAVWYVDTSLDYRDPDMQRFFETGEKVVETALDQSPVPPPGTGLAVEIGSGVGRICLALASRFDRVVGIDVSPEMVERARQLVDHSAVTFIVGSGTGLEPLEDSTADLIVSFTVFQHIPSVAIIERYLAEAGRVLKPGGVLAFQWNNQPGARLWRLQRTALSGLQRVGLRVERHRRNAPEFLGSRVSLAVIERALARGGLEIQKTEGLDTLFAFAWAQRRS
jgi:SAM-dependent methyltransferase